MAEKDQMEKLMKDLTDKGLLVGAGFIAFRIYMIPQWASKEQVEDMRLAYFAGAQHLYASIMQVLEPGDEPSEVDLQRMKFIHEELEDFRLHMERKLETKGSA